MEISDDYFTAWWQRKHVVFYGMLAPKSMQIMSGIMVIIG